MTSIIAFFILIGVLITVHEFGHFAVAKMCGVKCEVFSIGFGRPIIKFQRGETEYRLAWIPLGGYVRMLGQEPQENRDAADVGRSLMDKSPLIRILIYAAGPGMNLLLPFILIVPFIALSDQTAQVPSSDVGAVDSSMPAYEAGLRGGDKITRLDGQPVHAFWQIKERLSQYQPEQGTVKLGIERAGHDLINLEIKPRAIQSKHEFLGFEQTNYLIGYQVDALDSNIAITSQNSAAFKAGLRTFDRIISINGQQTRRYTDVIRAFSSLATGKRVQVVYERLTTPFYKDVPILKRKVQGTVDYVADGNSLGLFHASLCVSSVDPDGPARFLKRGDCLLSVDGQAYSLGTFLRSKLNDDPKRPKKITWLRNGVQMDNQIQFKKEIQQHPLAGDFPVWIQGFTLARQTMIPAQLTESQDRWTHGWFRAKTDVPREIEVTARSISGMFTGQVSPTQLGGPLTIFHLAGSAAEAGFDRFLRLMVLLSLSIGLFNLVPVPALDGGQILIASIEMVTRKPLPEKAQLVLHQIGVFLILALIIFALSNDAIRTWRLSNS